ncbi:MAG: hypothetical protein ACYDEE_05965 [Ignavibacteriaceae bacterium]
MKLKFGGSEEFLESVTKYCATGKQQLQGEWEYYFNGLENYGGMGFIPNLILTEIPQSLSLPILKDILSYKRLLQG